MISCRMQNWWRFVKWDHPHAEDEELLHEVDSDMLEWIFDAQVILVRWFLWVKEGKLQTQRYKLQVVYTLKQ